MTTITGTFKDSGQVAITSGVLRVQLNASLADDSTNPDSYLLTTPHDFAITNGALETCNLKESETQQVSYTFTVYQSFTDYDYYYVGSGEFYARNTDRPTHLYTDSKYYSGISHFAQSVQLERIARTRLEPIGDAFQAIVPNLSSVDFAQLERTGFATDRTPQTARQVAEVLRQNPLFMQNLIDFLVITPYDNATPYRRGNIVGVGGSAYQCIIDNAVGYPPASSSTHWRLFASKGEPGGIGGNDAAFAAGWDGDLNAPSKNAIYEYIIGSLAAKSEVALKANSASPAFTGAATYITQALGTGNGANKTRLATCEYAYSEAIERVRKLLISLAFVATSANPPQYAVRANGQTLSRTTYSELWAIANGTTGYGTGDGSTTFTVPNMASPGTGLYWVIFAGV